MVKKFGHSQIIRDLTDSLSHLKSTIFFIELNRLYTSQLTDVNLQLLHQQHVSALFGHHQAYKV